MQIHLISLFPTLFDDFFSTSLLGKAQEKGILKVHTSSPRQFCDDKHQQIDDAPYGGGAGMVLKAEPFIKAVESVIQKIGSDSYHIVLPSPTKHIFNQSHAMTLSSYNHIIFVCGRYEGIDHRFTLWLEQKHRDHFSKLSLGQFVLLGGEVAAMTMSEAITRLIPGVIKEETSRQQESYNPLYGMDNIEHPHYTRPAAVRGMEVPEPLLSGDQAAIENRRNMT